MAETSVDLCDPHTADREVIAAAGFLAGYSGRTREAYTLDLRRFVAWRREHKIGRFDVRRAEFELYTRQLEEHGRARATIGRRVSAIAGFSATPPRRANPALTCGEPPTAEARLRVACCRARPERARRAARRSGTIVSSLSRVGKRTAC